MPGSATFPDRHPQLYVLGRYTLFQLPELGVVGLALVAAVQYGVIPQTWGWIVAAAWLCKEIVLFPFVRSSYEPSNPNAASAMIGRVAVVVDRLDPRGTVRVGPELWAACLDEELPAVDAGSSLSVTAVEGLTLRVGPRAE